MFMALDFEIRASQMLKMDYSENVTSKYYKEGQLQISALIKNSIFRIGRDPLADNFFGKRV